MTPPLLITEYYDSLISQIDIYTEERIKEYKEKGLPIERKRMLLACGRIIFDDETVKTSEKTYGVETLENPYEEQTYTIERNDISKTEITEISQAEEYMNKVRQKAIEEIRKVKEETLKFYKTKKEEFKVDRKNLTEAKLEELKSKLFANRYCFLIKKGSEYYTLFKLHIVITDFYLRESDIDYIRLYNLLKFIIFVHLSLAFFKLYLKEVKLTENTK